MRVTNSFLPKRHSEPLKESINESPKDHHHLDMSRTTFGDFGGDDKMKNTKSILYIVLAFLAMAYTGVTFVFSILAYKDTSARTWHISQMVHNWKTKSILSITATSENRCAEGYEPMVGYIWPGTFEGCHWGDDVKEEKIRNTLVVGSCDTIQRQNDCKEVEERSPIYIRRFYPGKLLWVQRHGLNIIDIERPFDHDGKWPDDQKRCGPNEKPNLQTCVPVSDDCPIISILEDASDSEQHEGFTEVPLGDGRSLYYSSNDPEGGLPISELILSEGKNEEKVVCVNTEDTNVPKTKEIYDLLNTNFYRGWVSNVDGMQYDARWKYVLNVNEWDIVETNELFGGIIRNLPNHPDQASMETNKYNLFYRKYILWDEACEKDENSRMRKLAENLNPINTLANAQLFFMVICFLSLLVMGISSPIFIIIRHCMILRGEKRSTYQDVIISTGMRFVSFIFIVLKASFLISCLVLISNFHYIYVKARENDCTDDTTLFILSYVDEYLEYARRHNWVSLAAVIIIAFCEITVIVVLLILQRVAEKQRRDVRHSLLESLDASKG